MHATSRQDIPTDQEVVSAVLAGDRDRFRLLVERYHRRLYRTMLGLCGGALDAEDVTQEAFTRAYAALSTFRLDLPFYPWLHTIAHNLYVSRAARAAKLRLVSLDADTEQGRDESDPWLVDPSDGPAALSEREAVREALWAAVRALPEEFQSVFIMRVVHDMSYLEISQATDLPIGTVKSRLARARDRLAAILAAELS